MSRKRDESGPIFVCGRQGFQLSQVLLKPPPPEVLALARADVAKAATDEERESAEAYLRHLLSKLPKPRIVR